ncbi:hypothetical protein B566_EDAN012112 [Ephemera danica]|nr:hypothetical protein B566_EDAN012112 [Ephemera danica]
MVRFKNSRNSNTYSYSRGISLHLACCRYIVVEVNPTRSDEKNPKLEIKPYSLQAAILEKLEQLHGDFGLAAVRLGFTNPMFYINVVTQKSTKYCNPHTRVAYMRVRHGPHKLVTSSLPLVNRVHKTTVTLKLLYTGASLRHCNKFLEKYQKTQLQKLWPKLKTEEDKNFMREAFMKLGS